MTRNDYKNILIKQKANALHVFGYLADRCVHLCDRKFIECRLSEICERYDAVINALECSLEMEFLDEKK